MKPNISLYDAQCESAVGSSTTCSRMHASSARKLAVIIGTFFGAQFIERRKFFEAQYEQFDEIVDEYARRPEEDYSAVIALIQDLAGLSSRPASY